MSGAAESAAAATPALQGALTTLALCWRLDRRDGVSLGFTAHDRDLARGGLVYRARPGLLPSAVSQTDGFDADTLDLTGALSDAAITAADLAAGRWDGARCTVTAFDWADPAAPAIPVAAGELGDVSVRDGQFTAELRGPAALLERPVVERTSPDCRARLGDPRCRVPMAGRMARARVVAADGETLTLDRGEPEDNGYGFGRLRWLGGRNAGLVAAVAASAGTVVTLAEAPPFAAAAGDLVELRQGCDGLFATCVGRFGNAAHFRGEPHLPGADLLARYGEAG